METLMCARKMHAGEVDTDASLVRAGYSRRSFRSGQTFPSSRSTDFLAERRCLGEDVFLETMVRRGTGSILDRENRA